MFRDGIDPAEFAHQYAILATVVRVVQGKAYFNGTTFDFDAVRPPPIPPTEENPT